MVHLVDAPGRLLGFGVSHETIADVDAFDHEDAVLFLDFTSHVGR